MRGVRRVRVSVVLWVNWGGFATAQLHQGEFNLCDTRCGTALDHKRGKRVSILPR